MSLAENIKPISYLKANAAEIVRNIESKPLIITQNGEAKAVLIGIDEYEETQETLAMLKLLALGKKQIKEGKSCSVSEAVKRARESVRAG